MEPEDEGVAVALGISHIRLWVGNSRSLSLCSHICKMGIYCLPPRVSLIELEG